MLALSDIRLRLQRIARAAHPDPPHGKDGRFYSAGTAGGKDAVARDESLHPRSAASGEPVGGKGYALHRESEHLRESLGKLTEAGRERPELLSLATWRGHQGKNAIADYRGSLEAQLKSQGTPAILAVRELQALYAIYQRRLGTPGYAATAPKNVHHILRADSPSAARLRRESARIASYLKRYGFSAAMAGRERGSILSAAARTDLTTAVDAGIAQEQQQAKRSALTETYTAIRLLADVVRNYEYTTASGVEHEVITGAGGKWIDNKVIGHIGGTQPTPIGQRIAHLPIEQVHANPDQPRKFFEPEALKELAASIKEHGLLQPITVRPDPHGNGYQIVAGERRFRALAMNGATHVPAIVRDLSDQQVRELALIENLSRADMTPSETAKAFDGLLKGGMSVKELADKTGKSAAVIQQHLDLLAIEPHLQKLVDTGRLRFGIVSALSKLSPAGREEAASRILEKDLGVKSAKQLIQTIAMREQQTTMFPETRVPSKAARDAKTKYDAAITAITEQLAGLDDETMRNLVGTLESPSKESTRLGLMIRQLQRMQATLQLAGHNQETLALARPKKASAHAKRLLISDYIAQQRAIILRSA